MGVLFERGGLFEDLRYAVERNGCASAFPLGCPFPRSKFCGGVKLGGGGTITVSTRRNLEDLGKAICNIFS